MRNFLLDTNHLSDAIGKVSALRDRIRKMRRQGFNFGTCWPALFELEQGMVQTKGPAACRRNLRLLLKEVRIRPLDWDLMQAFGQVHVALKKQGRALSFVDKVLAALALQEKATVLTTDGDFQALPQIQTENWLP